MTMTKMMSEINEQPEILKNLESVNKETLTALCAELKSKNIKRCTFTARGTSYHASIYAQFLLAAKCGIVSSYAMASWVTVYGSTLFSAEDLVIGVSQSGYAADALAVLEEARKNGAVTVAVTNDKESPMAKFADYHLFCAAEEEISVAATKTFTSEMGALLLLAAYWSEDKALLANFAELHKSIAAALKICDEKISDLTDKFVNLEHGFVLSRGLTYPIALEATLKSQETCYVKMEGYSVADFYHGPLAQVDEKTAIILFAMKGASQKDNLAMADKLREIGAQPLVVTDDEEVAKAAPLSFLLPDTGSEFTSPFVCAIFAQRFAESLCGKKGLNPDQPRNLKKVTVTK